MKKLLLSTLMLFVGLCGLARADYPAQTKVFFNIHVPYSVKAGKIILPAGDYAVRDLGIAPSAVLAISEKGKSKPMALLYTVRIDRRLVGWTDQPRVVFDTEGNMPAMKKIFVPSQDGYEIIGATGNKDYLASGIVKVSQTSETTTTTEPIATPAPTPAPAVEPEPAPAVEPTPAPEVKQEEPAPAPEPIKERKRVRKD